MYTHYWRWAKPIANTRKFLQWSSDITLLASRLPEHSTTAGGYYDHEPLLIEGRVDRLIGAKAGIAYGTIATRFAVGFCGKAPEGRPINEEDLEGSDFYISLNHMEQAKYDFCPTGRYPYDLLVCAALIRLKVHFPQAEIWSDGDPKDWLQALQLCAETFGEAELPFPSQGEPVDTSWT